MTETGNWTSEDVALQQIAAQTAGTTIQNVLNIVENPDWNSAEPMYDWRNHVPDTLRKEWSHLLSTSSKLSVFVVCEREARREGERDARLDVE